LDIIINII